MIDYAQLLVMLVHTGLFLLVYGLIGSTVTWFALKDAQISAKWLLLAALCWFITLWLVLMMDIEKKLEKL